MDLTRTLRLKITFARNPRCLDTGGTQEHWKVMVWEVHNQGTKWPYSVEAELEWIDIPDRWWPKDEYPTDPLDLERFWENVRPNQKDGYVLCGHHREVIPGVRLTPTSIENFSKACTRARELALVISGYMTMEMLPTVEQAFEGSRWNSPKLKKAKPPPTGGDVEEGRDRIRSLLSGHVWMDEGEAPDMEYFESLLG